MSSYQRLTKHPVTGKWKKAWWIDDYYGSHDYGVTFLDVFNSSQEEYKKAEFFDPRKVELLTK